MKRSILACLLFLWGPFIHPLSAQWFISPSGSDTSSGSADAPFETIAKAHSVALPGDTLFLQGGTHIYHTTTTLSKSGSDLARLHLMAEPGTRALLDFSGMATSSSNRGLRISGNYWYLHGVDIKGAGDNGLQMSGSNNIVEFCTFFENRDSGVQLDNGASNNHFINCDSYFNADPSFENADGFAAKLTVGSGNMFTGCRAWQNADDGWDGYLRGTDNVITTLEECWSFMNGYLKDGTPSLPNGDGNGFKMGGSDDKTLHHDMILKRCAAFDNRVKGFDQNNNRGSMTLLNCTSYRNGTNYSLPGPIDTGRTITITNCVSVGSVGTITAASMITTSSWTGSYLVSDSDFLSLDTAGVRGPRDADGSLPTLGFLRLASGSDLIDAGTDNGLSYFGTSIDLGAFEFSPAAPVKPSNDFAPERFIVSQNYPNPFNPDTRIDYLAPGPGTIAISIHDLTGRRIFSASRIHSSAGAGSFTWNARLGNAGNVPSGSYIAVLRFGSYERALRLMLLR